MAYEYRSNQQARAADKPMKNVTLACSLAVVNTSAVCLAFDRTAKRRHEAILIALKNLDGLMDGMQKQIDDLKSGGAKAPPLHRQRRKSRGTTERHSYPFGRISAAAGHEAVRGWVVNVSLYVEYVRDRILCSSSHNRNFR